MSFSWDFGVFWENLFFLKPYLLVLPYFSVKSKLFNRKSTLLSYKNNSTASGFFIPLAVEFLLRYVNLSVTLTKLRANLRYLHATGTE